MLRVRISVIVLVTLTIFCCSSFAKEEGDGAIEDVDADMHKLTNGSSAAIGSVDGHTACEGWNRWQRALILSAAFGFPRLPVLVDGPPDQGLVGIVLMFSMFVLPICDAWRIGEAPDWTVQMFPIVVAAVYFFSFSLTAHNGPCLPHAWKIMRRVANISINAWCVCEYVDGHLQAACVAVYIGSLCVETALVATYGRNIDPATGMRSVELKGEDPAYDSFFDCLDFLQLSGELILSAIAVCAGLKQDDKFLVTKTMFDIVQFDAFSNWLEGCDLDIREFAGMFLGNGPEKKAYMV